MIYEGLFHFMWEEGFDYSFKEIRIFLIKEDVEFMGMILRILFTLLFITVAMPFHNIIDTFFINSSIIGAIILH